MADSFNDKLTVARTASVGATTDEVAAAMDNMDEERMNVLVVGTNALAEASNTTNIRNNCIFGV